MAARIGIELSPVTCRIIEFEAASTPGGDRATRVVSFTSLPASELIPSEPPLSMLRGRHATVVVWTPHSQYRQVEVAAGTYDRMRAEALRSLTSAAPATLPTLNDIAPASAFTPGMTRRPVLLVTVPRVEIAAALKPLKDAGIKVDAVLTPASALASLARLRGRLTKAGSVEMYVAVEETATTLALMEDGHLLAARTAAWGYLSELPSRYSVRPRPREEITMRLAEDIAVCLTSVGMDPSHLRQLCVCGGLPELRNMTLPLLEQLDVEVEPLDTLFGIDEEHLPSGGHDFRDRAAAFRLAWAAAADERPVLDLIRDGHRNFRRAAVKQAAVAAGVIVGLGGGWVLQQAWRPGSSPVQAAPVQTMAAATRRSMAPVSASLPPARPQQTAPQDQTTSTSGLQRTPGDAMATSLTGAAAPERAAARPTTAAAIAPPVTAPLPVAPPARRSVEPVVTPMPQSPQRSSREPEARALVSVATRSPDAAPSRARQAPEPVSAAQPVADSPPLPFDASLGTILYGPERKLAIVDGRIVQAGDDVRGATVVEITPTSVYLRDAQGQLRRLTAGGSSR